MHVLHLRRLGRLFPEARFVHVVRDGRDVAVSYRSVAWGPTTVEDAAMRWRRSVLRGRRDGERLGPDRYREVRYEDLVTDPERVLRELCAFLDLEWDDGVLHHHERAAEVIAATRFPGAHSRLLLPPTPGLATGAGRWRRPTWRGFEAIAGGLLDELGYGCGAVPPSVRRRATARCHDRRRPRGPVVGPGGGGSACRRPPGRPPMTSSSVADFEVRRYEPTDEAVVLDLLGASLGWQPDDLHARLFAWKHHENAFGVSPAWVATVGDRVVGFRTFMRWEFVVDGQPVKAVRAVDTATHPDHRGRGVFGGLTQHALDALRDDGVAFVFNTPNERSRPGYLAMGWRPVRRLPVLARPRSLPALGRIARARTAADKWSIPSTVGVPAAEAFADAAAVEALLGTLLDTAPDPGCQRTGRRRTSPGGTASRRSGTGRWRSTGRAMGSSSSACAGAVRRSRRRCAKSSFRAVTPR